jgi:uncharacterized RDD family membrane protein YckC
MPNQSKKQPAKAPTPAPAGWGRRIGALFIDWIASTLVLIAIIGPHEYSKPNGTVLVLPVWLAEVVLFTVFVGGSFGQIALGLRVRRVDGSRLSPWAVLVRAILIVLVIPPLIYKPDGRGLHDMAVDSAVYRQQ